MKNLPLNLINSVLVILIAVNIAGCASIKKKFTRKKANKEVKQAFIQTRKYDVKPSIALYRKHYIYWKNWQRELMEVFSDNEKKATVCVEEIISNLNDMYNLLNDEQSEKLVKHITAYEKVEKIMKTGSITLGIKTRVRRRLEAEARLIKRDFSYTKVEGFIRKEFR